MDNDVAAARRSRCLALVEEAVTTRSDALCRLACGSWPQLYRTILKGRKAYKQRVPFGSRRSSSALY